ncbi:MAG: rod shape-determining protein RodA [Flavobacteriaceae bacterium]|nr:rod shape-determining protein RodA [Flavobacteriaceae bacterium]
MRSNRHTSLKLDWLSIILFLLLVGFGYLNILSASASGEITSYFDMSQPYGKQLVFIVFTLVLIVVVIAIEAKFYERFSSLIYLISILSLIGLFLFGKTVHGATSWYAIGGMTIQPSEFAKFATALAVAKYISDLQTNIKDIKHQLKTVLIILVPAFLILLQNDAGSTIVYAAFFFVFYREGIPQIYLIVGLGLVILGVSSLKFSAVPTAVGATILIFLYHFLVHKKKKRIFQPILLSLVSLVFIFGVQLFYNNILQPHQQDRISLWLRLEKDPVKLEAMKKNILYNLHESEKAISSGGVTGKGFMEGTRTIGKFVPEQHTDYIFSTVGEEWGFVGSSIVVILFVLLIIRLLHLAELQKSQFSRVYGYAVASILFIHFLINVGMVMGLIPTVGIPLPFFSYGGSSLWGFTILLFIFIKLDANRLNEW